MGKMRVLWLTKSTMLSFSPASRGADDAHRLVEGDEDQAVGLARLDH